jgi:hypothetical protein
MLCRIGKPIEEISNRAFGNRIHSANPVGAAIALTVANQEESLMKKTMKIGLLTGLVLSGAMAASKEKSTATEPAKGIEKAAPAVAGKPMECMPSPEAMDKLLLTVQDAEKSGDKAKMIAALAATETHIKEMKAHKEKCKGMMGGEEMKGMGCMKGMKGKDSDSTAAPAVRAKPEDDASNHEKHH